MSQLGFQRQGAAYPWVIDAPYDAAPIYVDSLVTVKWSSGSPDDLFTHNPAVIYGTSALPDITSGHVYILFTTQGSRSLFMETVENAADMDTLVGAGTVWGILGFVDQNHVEDWKQY